MSWNWKTAPAGGSAPGSHLSQFSPTPTPPPPSLEEQQQDEAAAAAALAISDRRTLYLVNIFIGSAARFLNSFAAVCEDKLADVHRRIVRVDSTLRLLEANLRGTSSNDSGERGNNRWEPAREHLHHSSSSSSASIHPSPTDQTASTDPPTGR